MERVSPIAARYGRTEGMSRHRAAKPEFPAACAPFRPVGISDPAALATKNLVLPGGSYSQGRRGGGASSASILLLGLQTSPTRPDESSQRHSVSMSDAVREIKKDEVQTADVPTAGASIIATETPDGVKKEEAVSDAPAAPLSVEEAEKEVLKQSECIVRQDMKTAAKKTSS